MSVRENLRTPVAELVTWRYTGVIKDETGTVLGSADLDTLTLTLYNVADGAILNSVSGVDILNVGRGVIDASGNLAITFLPADNPIVDAAKSAEQHEALIEWTYAAAVQGGKHVLVFSVTNLTKVP